MPQSTNISDSAKFKLILQLSQDQIEALKHNDFSSFERTLTAKAALIASLRGRNDGDAVDSSSTVILSQIAESELFTEKILRRRLTSIENRLGEIQQSKAARRAYRKEERKLPRFVPSTETPLMFDLRS